MCIHITACSSHLEPQASATSLQRFFFFFFRGWVATWICSVRVAIFPMVPEVRSSPWNSPETSMQGMAKVFIRVTLMVVNDGWWLILGMLTMIVEGDWHPSSYSTHPVESPYNCHTPDVRVAHSAEKLLTFNGQCPWCLYTVGSEPQQEQNCPMFMNLCTDFWTTWSCHEEKWPC